MIVYVVYCEIVQRPNTARKHVNGLNTVVAETRVVKGRHEGKGSQEGSFLGDGRGERRSEVCVECVRGRVGDL